LNDNLYRYIDYASENLEDADFQTAIEELLINPLDLNSVSKTELLNIPFLAPNVADQIIAYRNSKKGFKSLDELLKIESIDQDLFLLLRP
jgi:DNA uptake protein ComE-like DNA-binding protein